MQLFQLHWILLYTPNNKQDRAPMLHFPDENRLSAAVNLG